MGRAIFDCFITMINCSIVTIVNTHSYTQLLKPKTTLPTIRRPVREINETVNWRTLPGGCNRLLQIIIPLVVMNANERTAIAMSKKGYFDSCPLLMVCW